MKLLPLLVLGVLGGASGAPQAEDTAAVHAALAAAPSVLAPPPALDLAAVQATVEGGRAAVAMRSLPRFSLSNLVERQKAKAVSASALSSCAVSSPYSPSLMEEAASTSLSSSPSSKVPVEDQLPSMSPMDGLDKDLANGPLPNPRPLKGEPNQEIPGYPSSNTELLPSAGEVLGTAPSAGKMYLTPGNGLNLPPLPADDTVNTVAEKDPRAVLNLPNTPYVPKESDAGGDGKQAERVETPAHAAYTAHPWRVSPSIDADGVEHGNQLVAPYVAPPTEAWAHAYHEMTGSAMPSLPLFHQHVLTGDVHPPTTAYQAFLHEKARLEAQRAHYLATLKQRMAAIEHARSFVDGGSAWVNKMKAEWDAWLEKERAKGSTSIVAEENKVKQQQAVLERLEREQKEDMKRINLYNHQIRQAATHYKLSEHQAKLAKAAEEQQELQAKLDASKRHQAEVEARIADMSKTLEAETGTKQAQQQEGGDEQGQGQGEEQGQGQGQGEEEGQGQGEEQGQGQGQDGEAGDGTNTKTKGGEAGGGTKVKGGGDQEETEMPQKGDEAEAK